MLNKKTKIDNTSISNDVEQYLIIKSVGFYTIRFLLKYGIMS